MQAWPLASATPVTFIGHTFLSLFSCALLAVKTILTKPGFCIRLNCCLSLQVSIYDMDGVIGGGQVASTVKRGAAECAVLGGAARDGKGGFR